LEHSTPVNASSLSLAMTIFGTAAVASDGIETRQCWTGTLPAGDERY
jgi:hypothetical protein